MDKSRITKWVIAYIILLIGPLLMIRIYEEYTSSRFISIAIDPPSFGGAHEEWDVSEEVVLEIQNDEDIHYIHRSTCFLLDKDISRVDQTIQYFDEELLRLGWRNETENMEMRCRDFLAEAPFLNDGVHGLAAYTSDMADSEDIVCVGVWPKKHEDIKIVLLTRTGE